MEDAERKFNVRYEEGVEPLTFPATWYQSVNACCVVIFAPLFMLMWGVLARFGIEPSTPTKFALGLLLVSASFIVMIPGAFEAANTGGKSAVYWLLMCYLLATWGELCLSPIGLSMVTKLAPARYVSQFMGLWFLASSLSYLMAGYAASYFGSGEGITIIFGKDGGLADFFVLMAAIPFVIGIIALAMAPMLKKRMHGIH
jgi:POT family proton-dependent oligopeptide transporter